MNHLLKITLLSIAIFFLAACGRPQGENSAAAQEVQPSSYPTKKALPLSAENCSHLFKIVGEIHRNRAASNTTEPFQNAYLLEDSAAAMAKLGYDFDETMRSLNFVFLDRTSSCSDMAYLIPLDPAAAKAAGLISDRTAYLFSYAARFGDIHLSPVSTELIRAFSACEAELSGPCPLRQACKHLRLEIFRPFPKEYPTCDALFDKADEQMFMLVTGGIFDVSDKESVFFNRNGGQSNSSVKKRDSVWSLNQAVLKQYYEGAKIVSEEESKYKLNHP